MWFLIMLSDYLKFISEVFPLSVYNHVGNIYIYMMIHIDSYWFADARPYARHTIGMLPGQLVVEPGEATFGCIQEDCGAGSGAGNHASQWASFVPVTRCHTPAESPLILFVLDRCARKCMLFGDHFSSASHVPSKRLIHFSGLRAHTSAAPNKPGYM